MPGDAEAALQAAAGRERVGVAVPLVGIDALQRRDGPPLDLRERLLAGDDGPAVDEDGAAAALARRRAAILGRRDVELLAQRGEQVRVVGAHGDRRAVDDEADRARSTAVMTDAPHRSGSSALRFSSRRALCADPPVQLGAAVAVEVEQGAGVAPAPVEVAVRRDQLVTGRQRLGDDLPARGDDARLGQRVDPLLDATLGHGDDPRAVLVRTGLEHQRVVEALQDVLARVGRVVDGRVVAAEDQLDALEPHHAVGLGPASVVADHHPDPAAEGLPHAGLVRSRLEVVALGVLERAVGLVVLVTGDVHLAVAGDDAPVPLDEHLRVVVVSVARARRSRGRSRSPGGPPRRTAAASPARAWPARTSPRRRGGRPRTNGGRRW